MDAAKLHFYQSNLHNKFSANQTSRRIKRKTAYGMNKLGPVCFESLKILFYVVIDSSESVHTVA